MFRFLVFIILLLFSTSGVKKPDGCLKLDVILIGDYSLSVEHYERFVYDAFKSFVYRIETSEDGIKIGLIKFNTKAYLLSHLTSDKEELKKAVESFNTTANGATDMSAALHLALDEFTKNSNNDRQKIIVMVSDGLPQDQENVLLLARQLKEIAKINICSILIYKIIEPDETAPYLWFPGLGGNGRDHLMDAKFMQQLSSNCYLESDYENLEKELKKLDLCM